MQSTLDAYGAGITVTSISLEELDYPQEVQQAVDDAQQAENDAGRYVLEADTYEMDIIPKARGRAARVRLDAEAYRDRVIRDAEGEAGRFEALLTEYQKAPRVTRDRLYLDAIEEVYSNSTKIIIDSEGSAATFCIYHWINCGVAGPGRQRGLGKQSRFGFGKRAA